MVSWFDIVSWYKSRRLPLGGGKHMDSVRFQCVLEAVNSS